MFKKNICLLMLILSFNYVLSQSNVDVVYNDLTQSINYHLDKYKNNKIKCLEKFSYDENLFEIYYQGNDSLRVKVEGHIIFNGKTNSIFGLFPELLYSSSEIFRKNSQLKIEVEFIKENKICTIELKKKYSSIVISSNINLELVGEIKLVGNDRGIPIPKEVLLKQNDVVKVDLFSIDYKIYQNLLVCLRE